MTNKKWYSTELPKEIAGRFKEYCRDMHYRYESSECFNLIHFSVYLAPNEVDSVNKFIDNIG